jgi:hypothetical protein
MLDHCNNCIWPIRKKSVLQVWTGIKVPDPDGLFRNGKEHEKHSTRQGIQPDVKAKLKKLLKDRVNKPKQILQVLHEEHPEGVPTTRQLSNFLARARNELFGSCTISFGQLQAWAESNMAVPEDEDEPFVCGWEGNFEQSEDESFFRFAVTSKRLVKIYSTSQNFHADSTYKNVWQGFPVLIMGPTDRNRAIHR